MAKGSAFERSTCKELSKWWSGGTRDDIFWRSSQSGGRATQRAKKGQSTFGSYGDITAVDPIGAPLLKMWTIELKRGRSHGDPGDLLDFKEQNKSHPFARTICQAIRSAEQANSASWMIVSRRDCRRAVVFFETYFANELEDLGARGILDLCIRYRLKICGDRSHPVSMIGLPLERFFERVHPDHVKKLLESMKF